MKGKSWKQILYKIDNIDFREKFDLTVAITRGGIVPGFLISKKLKTDFELLWIKFRNDKNEIMFKRPKLQKKINFNYKGKTILLVDDVCRTNATLNAAKRYLRNAKTIKTFAINGKADYSLYDEECLKFPWS